MMMKLMKGAPVAATTLAAVVVGVVLACGAAPTTAAIRAFAAPDGIMYGINSTLGFVTIDPATGKTTPVSAPLPDEAQAQNLASMDTLRGIYYMLGFNLTNQEIDLIGIDVVKGTIANKVKLPFVSSALIGVGEAVDVDESNGEVFCLGLQADNKHHLFRVNPRTGATKHLADCGYINVLGGAHAFDQTNNLVWLQFAANSSGEISLDLLGFDAITGTLKKTIKEPDTNGIYTLSYDIQREQMIGFGYDASKGARTLLRLNTNTGSVSRIGVVPGYSVINGNIVTVDSRSGVIYAQFQSSNNQTAPFDIVGVDVSTAKVVSHAPLCVDPADCPWSMEFRPTQH
ncbi:hypothetical protein PTSG_05174 [Salpingoeca rosetta]|uniref:Uncharacterized protein n=1 Tax=Salpingoeca rosetta (strain ATCC 50818 / BSB-021) TaxID=946362 RepID=F2UAQ3_SALR5|nr:uncharacterized protein PTSG_05174 [Salpingoeca rosetta]EGD73469.1 hypothetical protein PTSG_05174 [Salpingoeca rosetta]|eukprot:XP_004993751.1 hypothetical protein PTSG_05174 [Salpingoeca rosetta]